MKGYLRKWKSGKLLVYVCFFVDLLQPAAFLLHVFQAEDVNAVTVSFTMSTVMKQLDSLRDKEVHKLQMVRHYLYKVENKEYVYSMIDDTIKDIEEECHEWFKDAYRLADKIGATVSVPRITGRQEHRNNAPSVSAESHYRVNVAIPFIDHLLEEMSSRFSKDNRARAEIFSLVTSAVVKHNSLHNLAEKL